MKKVPEDGRRKQLVKSCREVRYDENRGLSNLDTTAELEQFLWGSDGKSLMGMGVKAKETVDGDG